MSSAVNSSMRAVGVGDQLENVPILLKNELFLQRSDLASGQINI